MSIDPSGADVLSLDEPTWTEARDLDRERLVAILPIGAVEARGPHLPVSTDRVIALAIAGGARRCNRHWPDISWISHHKVFGGEKTGAYGPPLGGQLPLPG